jgi:hypothetical protein
MVQRQKAWQNRKMWYTLFKYSVWTRPTMDYWFSLVLFGVIRNELILFMLPVAICMHKDISVIEDCLLGGNTKSHPKFPVLELPSCLKLILGLLATIIVIVIVYLFHRSLWLNSATGCRTCHPQSSPFGAYTPFSPLLPLFKMNPGSHVLWGCIAPPAILPRSPQLWPNGDISVLASVGEIEKSGVEDDSQVVFSQKALGEKGSVRRCVIVMQQPVFLSPKFEAKSSHIFTHLP